MKNKNTNQMTWNFNFSKEEFEIQDTDNDFIHKNKIEPEFIKSVAKVKQNDIEVQMPKIKPKVIRSRFKTSSNSSDPLF